MPKYTKQICPFPDAATEVRLQPVAYAKNTATATGNQVATSCNWVGLQFFFHMVQLNLRPLHVQLFAFHYTISKNDSIIYGLVDHIMVHKSCTGPVQSYMNFLSWYKTIQYIIKHGQKTTHCHTLSCHYA